MSSPLSSTSSTSIDLTIAHPSNGSQTLKNPDTFPDHNHHEASMIARMTPEEYADAEKKLVKKLDWKIVPWMTLLFTMSFLDRINIGTAKLAGLNASLGMTNSQYNNASVIFFVSYVVFEIPAVLVLKKVKPSRWIPFIMIMWSIFQVCMGLVTNYQGLLAMRFIVGMFEATLFPGISFLISGYYLRKETSKRISVFFAGAVLAGAFGGILGYALSRMKGVGGKAGWCWIFIIEGLLSFIIGVISLWMVQDFPSDATFLTPLEKELLLHRISKDVGLGGQGTFSWKIVRRAVKDWKTWVLMGMYIGVAEPIYSQSIFTPTIIAALGTWSTAQSLLLSTPPYVFAFCTTMITAYLSDRTGQRGIFIMFWTFMAIIGYICFLTIPISKPGGLYFACFLTVGAIAPCIATVITWSGNTFTGHYKKATSMGMIFSLGNSGGIVASQVYRSNQAPRYLVGHGITLGFCGLSFICSIILYFGLRRENARRDAKYGPVKAFSHRQTTSLGEKSGTMGDEDEDEEVVLERWGLKGMSKEEVIALGDDHPGHRFFL